MVSLWTALTVLAPILAPIVSLTLLFIGKVIWNHEKRLRSLDQSKTRHGRTLYGDDEDRQQPGITTDLNDLIERMDRIEHKIDKLNGKHEESEDDA